MVTHFETPLSAAYFTSMHGDISSFPVLFFQVFDKAGGRLYISMCCFLHILLCRAGIYLRELSEPASKGY